MSRYHTIVLTAGTSALGPRNAPGAWLREHAADLVTSGAKPTDPWGLVDPLAEPVEVVQKVFERHARANTKVEDAQGVSAEYSALTALRGQGRLAKSGRIKLIHTDTFDGVLAATLVSRLLERDFDFRVDCIPVEGLDVDQPAALRRNLGAFMHQVWTALKDIDRAGTCFAPIGGYKIMTALGYLAGSSLGVPSGYLYESGQVWHEVPAVPLRFDAEALQDEALQEVISRGRREVAVAALSDAARAAAEAHAYLFESTEVDGERYLALNAFGHFILSQHADRLGTRVELLAPVAASLAADDGWIRSQLANLLGKLTAPRPDPNVLRHEANFKIHGAALHLYKGASNGRKVFRALYAYDEAQDRLRVAHIWLDHDLYEREAKSPARYATPPERAWQAAPFRLA